MKSPDALKNNLMFYNNVFNSYDTRRYSHLANIFAIYLESFSITIIGHSGLTSELKLVDDGKPPVAKHEGQLIGVRSHVDMHTPEVLH